MKWMYGGLSIVFLIIGLLLLVREDQVVRILSSPRVYSFAYTDPLEPLAIDLATTSPSFYTFDTELIERIQIHDDVQSMGFEVKDIIVGDTLYYQEEEWTIIRFVLQPKLIGTSSTFQIMDANMSVDYTNGSSIVVPIGEFNYTFATNSETHLTTGSIHATYTTIHDIETVNGIVIELINRTNDVIVITDIDVLSQQVGTNVPLIQRDITCDTSLEGCLDVEEYALFLPRIEAPMSETLLPRQSMTLVVPLLYDVAYPFHRFPIQVTYTIHQQEHVLWVDDFPFLRTQSVFYGEDVEYFVTTIDSTE